MGSHRPLASSRRYAARLASQVGADIETSRTTLAASIETSRTTLAASIEQVARQARLAPSTVVRVLHGDAGVHLDTLCAVGAAVGLRIGITAFPSTPPSLRDSGQMRTAQYLVAQGHPSRKPALELPVGDPFGRAADLVFFGPDDILHAEIERRLPDFQAAYRAASVKRDALQAQHSRPVRLVLVIEDTRRNRAMIAPHAELIRTALPATSATVLQALRAGTPLNRDGLLWVRPWRSRPDKSSG